TISLIGSNLQNCLYSLDRKGAVSGLVGENNSGITTLLNIYEVTDLAPRGAGMIHHVLEHLAGHQDRSVESFDISGEEPVEINQPPRTELGPEISPAKPDFVAGLCYILNPVERELALYL